MTMKKIVGIVGACFLGTSLALALGAAKPETPSMPQYNVQYAGPILLITENKTNKLYIYENTGGKASELLQVIDLTQTGKAELVAVKAK